MPSWRLTKRTQYFRRPVLVGGEQLQIAGRLGGLQRDKQKETVHPHVSRQFTSALFTVSIILEAVGATENQPNQKELLLDFRFPTSRKSFETTQI